MWGNLHGWLISAALAALVMLPIGWIVRASGISDPAGPGADPANLAPLALPVDPDDAWPLFTSDADAAGPYMQTIDAWSDDAEQACAAFLRDPQGRPPSALQGLLDARHDQRMSLFSVDLPELINYDADHPRLEKLFAAGNWAWRIGLSLQQHGQPDAARVDMEAAFALGRQLYRQRIIFDECQKGMQLMSDAAQAALQTGPRGSEFFDRLTDLQNAMSDYQEQRVIPIWQVIGGVDQQVIARSAGDVLAFALHSRDRMWRVEATLALGRYRYDAASLGDQMGAARAARQLSADPDPAVATAGKAARDLTIQAYRMIH